MCPKAVELWTAREAALQPPLRASGRGITEWTLSPWGWGRPGQVWAGGEVNPASSLCCSAQALDSAPLGKDGAKEKGNDGL